MRVLEEASNKRHPLLERVRFPVDFADNLDEFYMVRVAGLVDMLQTRSTLLSDDGMTPAEQLLAIRDRASRLMAHQQGRLGSPPGRTAGGRDRGRRARRTVLPPNAWLDQYFIDQVFPIRRRLPSIRLKPVSVHHQRRLLPPS